MRRHLDIAQFPEAERACRPFGTVRCNLRSWPQEGIIPTAKLMLAPTARQLEQCAEEVRAIAAEMRDRETKRIMTTLALTYERLAEFAARHEASGRNAPQG